MRIGIITFILLSCILCGAQKSEDVIIELDFSATQLEVDALGFIYAISDTQIDKYDSKGELLFTYNASVTDRIATVDVSRALRPMVFFEEQGRVVFLDNTLSQQNFEINLNVLPFHRITAIAPSVDNHLWVYDSGQHQIFRLNESMEVVSQSGNMAIWSDLAFAELRLREYEDQLYVADAEGGMVLFDLYANYLNQIIRQGVTDFFFNGGKLLSRTSTGWVGYSPLLKDEVSTESISSSEMVRFGDGVVYELSGRSILIRQLEEHQ